MFLALLEFLRTWYRCRYKDLHVYGKKDCADCETKAPVKSVRCPDCGQRAVFAMTSCCKREMWIHTSTGEQ